MPRKAVPPVSLVFNVSMMTLSAARTVGELNDTRLVRPSAPAFVFSPTRNPKLSQPVAFTLSARIRPTCGQLANTYQEDANALTTWYSGWYNGLAHKPSQKDAIAAAFARRMRLLGRAILFAVLSALLTAALLIGAFLAALAGVSHGCIVAMMFAASLALLIDSLVELTREIRVYMAQMHLE